MTENAVTPVCMDLNKLEMQRELGISALFLWLPALLLVQPV